MRLSEYLTLLNRFYELNEDVRNEKLNEIIDFSTKVSLVKKSLAREEWYFKVKDDLYHVYVGNCGKNEYDITYGLALAGDEMTTNLTNKKTPFVVLDGVAVVIKKLIEDKKPKKIIFNIASEEKKINVFFNVIKSVMKKSDVFDGYNVKKKAGTFPKELMNKNQKSVKIILNRK